MNLQVFVDSASTDSTLCDTIGAEHITAATKTDVNLGALTISEANWNLVLTPLLPHSTYLHRKVEATPRIELG